MQFASFHASFDHFHVNADRIFRIVATTPNGSWNNVPPILLWLKEISTEIEATPALMTSAGGIARTKPESGSNAQVVIHKEIAVAYANNDFFTTFSFPFLAGGAELQKPNTVVITSETAQKYFACGNNYASTIGKRLTMTNQFGITEFTVTGVLKPLPEETMFRCTMLFSLQTLANPANLGGNSWAKLDRENPSPFLEGFVMVKNGVNASIVAAQLNELQRKSGGDKAISWHLQPIKHIHTGNGFGDPLPNGGLYKLVVISAFIAFFVLVLAFINYINLSTAFGLSRAREIGVRKTIGASRSQLILPVLLECFMLIGISFSISLATVEVLQKPFNTLVGAELGLRYAMNFSLGLLGWIFIVLGTLLSGGYVAMVLSGVNPIVVLKGNFAHSKSGKRVRQGLVIAQFAITIAFIIGTIVVFEQLNYMRNRDLGMNLDQVYILDGVELLDDEAPGGADIADRALAFKNALSQLSFISSVSGSQNIPGGGYNFRTEGFKKLSGSIDDTKKGYSILITDENFFQTFGMEFLAGKSYVQADNLGNFKFRNVVVNEAAALQLGFKSAQEAIGQYVEWGDVADKGQKFQIAGVLKNYHHQSLKTRIEPIIFLPSMATSYFSVKIATSNLQSNITSIAELYKKFFPENLYTAKFADEMFQKQYEADTRIGKVFGVFTVVAICIACLGLFGLVAYSVEMRTKEIGVRKVLGASDGSIVGLFAKEFLLLVGVSSLISMPFAWYLMSTWLMDFAYHLELRSGYGVLLFALSGLFAMSVAFVAIVGRALQAARGNVISAIRSE
jgi:putative ABC transport system permease protein